MLKQLLFQHLCLSEASLAKFEGCSFKPNASVIYPIYRDQVLLDIMKRCHGATFLCIAVGFQNLSLVYILYIYFLRF